MPKRIRTWNENKYRKYLAEGRGQGELLEYVPWVQIQDFPSKGIVSRVKGRTTGRVHHLVSNLELWYFYLIDWSEKTMDIREQFPLSDISDAIGIADSCGISYPYDNISGFPYVMTTDFLITTYNGYLARSIKPSEALKKRRVKEKLEIERRYWLKRGIDWKVVTENELPRTRIRNIEWIYSGNDFSELIHNKKVEQECKELFMEMYYGGKSAVAAIAIHVENIHGLEKGVGIALFKLLIRDGLIAVDLNKQINLTEPRNEEYNGTEYFCK